ncbi:MAG: LysR family transcriptional regulator [Lachnospiraceae bacterium]|nr:LysR family transcriptional regulator [Lachnospiraceae bacterium]
MNFQNLEYFLAVARENNITKAAEQLGITQQALSNQISRMEDELGCRLFNRKHGFQLTAAGKEMLKSSKRILDIFDQTQLVMNDISDNKRGELRIGITHTRGQYILPVLLPDFARMYPNVSLSLTEGSTRLLEESLDRGDIDLLIGFKPFMSADAVITDLMKENLFIAAPKELLIERFGDDYSSILAEYKKKPDLSLFKDMPFVLLLNNDCIRTAVEYEFKRAEIEPYVRLETQNVQTAFVLAAEGLGLTVIPGPYLKSKYLICGDDYAALRDKVEILPFTAPPNIIAVGYNPRKYLSRIAQDFIDLAVEKFSKIASETDKSRQN